jgi:phosphatidylglycerophosphatase A
LTLLQYPAAAAARQATVQPIIHRMRETPEPATPAPPAVHPTLGFVLAHPAHFIALGAGSGLPRLAPGTAGTLWAWATFVLLQPVMNDGLWAALIVVGTLVGWWACTVTAQHMGVADSGHIVWDEIIAFWLVLWLVTPASFWAQLSAFALFRVFDAVKIGPMAWADQQFKGFGARGGFGILLDDFAAAFCTLLVIALWRY